MNHKYSNSSNYNNSDSKRTRINALRKRRRKKLLIRRCIVFIFMILLLIILWKSAILVKEEKPETKKENKTTPDTASISSDDTTLPSDALASLNELAKKDERVAKIIQNYKQYPEELLELIAKNQETIDFVLDYPKKKDIPCASTIGTVTKGEIPHLLQWDERWGYGIYSDKCIAINGCGPTALAMVCAGLTGDNTITPYRLAQYAADNGYYVPESGSSWDLMRTGAIQFGITSKEVPLNESSMKNQLNAGHPIICSMKPGDFTTTGHFIVLTAYEDGSFRVLDPNSIQKSERLWSYERLSTQINNLWAFSLS